MRPCSLLLLFATAMLLTAPAARASGVPSAANSTLPACMTLCPMGDMRFTLVVRDLANNPVVGGSVVLDFSNCPNAFICRPGFSAPFPYTVDLTARTIAATTDASGQLSLPAHIGGTGPAGSVRVFANGVLLKSYALASPDQNGNGVAVTVVDVDEAIFVAKLGTLDPTADFDCDGDVDVYDQLIFDSHLSHSCDGYVDATRRSTWGSVKLHYR